MAPATQASSLAPARPPPERRYRNWLGKEKVVNQLPQPATHVARSMEDPALNLPDFKIVVPQTTRLMYKRIAFGTLCTIIMFYYFVSFLRWLWGPK